MATNSNSPLYFNCHLCGDCCSSWSIPIEREKAETLLTRDWVQARLTESHRELLPLSQEEYRLPLTDENVCVFLGADRRCLIEVHEGPDLKPTDCKRFPFAAVKLPDGTTRHDTSAVCKHISEQLLLAFQPILPKPQELPKLKELFAGDALEALPARVYVDLLRTCSWQDMDEHWETRLRPIFMRTDISTVQALRQADALIHGWARLTNEINFEQAHNKLRFSDWMTLCFLRKPYGTLSWLSLLLGKCYGDPRIFGLSVDLKAVRKIAWDPALDHHLNAFLYSILMRKRLLARGASIQSLLAMGMIAVLLVRWYATVLASLKSEELVTQSDVTLAVRLVERYYTGHQPRFLKLFCNRWRGALLLRLMC